MLFFGTIKTVDLTRTAFGTWSGGRYMHFGEKLGEDRYLGLINRGDMDKDFEKAAFSLDLGGVSDIVKTGFGYHLIKVTELEAGEVKPFATVRVEVERSYRRQLAEDTFYELGENLAQTREIAYSKAFELSFAQAYAQNYPQFRKSHYKAVESKAFESLYRERYLKVFQPTSEKTYSEALPGERKRQYVEGRKTEKADFESRPVRLLGVGVRFRNDDAPVTQLRLFD